MLDHVGLIPYEDFEKVDFRSGTVTIIKSFPRAKKPAYKVNGKFTCQIFRTYICLF